MSSRNWLGTSNTDYAAPSLCFYLPVDVQSLNQIISRSNDSKGGMHVCHVYTSRSVLPLSSLIERRLRLLRICFHCLDQDAYILMIRCAPHSGSMRRLSSGSVVVIPTWQPLPRSQLPQCVQPTATASAVPITHPSAPNAIAFATSYAVLMPPLAIKVTSSLTPSSTGNDGPSESRTQLASQCSS